MIAYKRLDVWKKSLQLVKATYVLVGEYPRDEIYALTSQTKRAVVSVPSNIAEGVGRNYKKETIQFLHIARGPLYELDTLLSVAIETEIITEKKLGTIQQQVEECLKMLNGLIAYYERSNLK